MSALPIAAGTSPQGTSGVKPQAGSGSPAEVLLPSSGTSDAAQIQGPTDKELSYVLVRRETVRSDGYKEISLDASDITKQPSSSGQNVLFPLLHWAGKHGHRVSVPENLSGSGPIEKFRVTPNITSLGGTQGQLRDIAENLREISRGRYELGLGVDEWRRNTFTLTLKAS